MKKNVIVLLVLACLPLWMVAQNTNDDLYFIPKKKVEKKKEAVETKCVSTNEYVTPGTPIAVKDVEGNVRDVDEYNRRYTSRDNRFLMKNDTLYIEEKPYDERGEWVNGFDGSQSDYEYAMRIIRFRNPYFAIPVSSPLYWNIVYGSLSWEWNVFDDGFYAYAFPTFSNSLWWNWRWNWGWGSSWHYGWHYPYWGFGSHWHYPYGHYGYHHLHHLHHYHHGWAGVGGYWGKKHGWNGSTATRPGVHAGRYKNSYQTRYASAGTSNHRVVTGENRNSRNRYVNGVRQSTNRSERTNRVSSGRVVTAKDATGSSSVRPQRSATRTRTNGNVSQKDNGEQRGNNTYTRPVGSQRSSYTRQSSTRSTVKNSPSYQRKSEAAERGAYRNHSSSSRSSESRSSYENSSSSSPSRSSYSNGSASRSSSGGGSSRSGGGSRSARR